AVVLTLSCARSPEANEARFLARGKEQLAKRNYEKAILEFKNASSIMPKDAEPFYELALVYAAVKDRASAVNLLRRATELNPNHTQAQIQLARLLAGSPNATFLDDARRRLQALLSHSPNNADALDDLAVTELASGHFDTALAELQKAVESSPQHIRSAIGLA